MFALWLEKISKLVRTVMGDQIKYLNFLLDSCAIHDVVKYYTRASAGVGTRTSFSTWKNLAFVSLVLQLLSLVDQA